MSSILKRRVTRWGRASWGQWLLVCLACGLVQFATHRSFAEAARSTLFVFCCGSVFLLLINWLEEFRDSRPTSPDKR